MLIPDPHARPAPPLKDQAQWSLDWLSQISLAFVDLETTGSNARTDRITEIGIVTVEGHEIREWSSLVNPGVRISPFIENLTGISDAMVRNAPPFEALASEVHRRLQGKAFVAHNASFDHGFLQQALNAVGLQLDDPVLCTVALSRQLWPEERRHNLDVQIDRHQLKADARHRALADADLARQLWWQLRSKSDELAFGDAVARQLFRRRKKR